MLAPTRRSLTNKLFDTSVSFLIFGSPRASQASAEVVDATCWARVTCSSRVVRRADQLCVDCGAHRKGLLEKEVGTVRSTSCHNILFACQGSEGGWQQSNSQFASLFLIVGGL